MSSSTSSASGIMSASAAKPVKSVAKKAAPVAVAAPVAAPVPAPVEKAVKAKKAPAAPAAAAPVVVASTPVEVVAEVAAAPATTLEEDLKSVTQNLTTLRETIAAMFAQVKKLDKRVHREIKDARKRKRRAAPVEGAEVKPRVPSIFERPTKITDELCAFLGKPAATLMSRSEVTKAVNNYVKEKSLKDKHNITPDAALKKLLAIPDGDVLTYFNLQRYLNRHYVKAPVATATA